MVFEHRARKRVDLGHEGAAPAPQLPRHRGRFNAGARRAVYHLKPRDCIFRPFGQGLKPRQMRFRFRVTTPSAFLR